jgi:alpha-galactosidase/6-phospho-beta-glucosidase family protein
MRRVLEKKQEMLYYISKYKLLTLDSFNQFGGIYTVEKNKDSFVTSQDHAREIFANAQSNQMRFGVATTAEIEQIRREYIERAQRRIDIYRENEQEHLETMMREIDEQRSEKLRRIKVAYDSNGIQWIDEIFKSIISAD